MYKKDLKIYKSGQYLRIVSSNKIMMIDSIIDQEKVLFKNSDQTFTAKEVSDRYAGGKRLFDSGKRLFQPDEWYLLQTDDKHRYREFSGKFVKFNHYHEDNRISVILNGKHNPITVETDFVTEAPGHNEVITAWFKATPKTRKIMIYSFGTIDGKIFVPTVYDPVSKKMFNPDKIFHMLPMPIIKLTYGEDFLTLVKANLDIIEKIIINDITFNVIGIENDKENRTVN